jgi:hypothetical protein
VQVLLSNKPIKLEIGSLILLLEEKAHGMHQNEAQQAGTQMPQITLELTAISHLTQHGVDEGANPPQDNAVIGGGFGRVRKAYGSLQENSFGAQEGLQIGKPLLAIAQHHAGCAFQQDGYDFSVCFIGRGQKQAGQHARPTELGVQPKARKRLPIRMILAIARFAAEADTPRRTRKPTDRNGDAVHNGERRIIADQFVAQPAPQSLFDRPQIGRLAHKGGAMQASECGKKVRVVPLERVKEFLLLRQAQGTSDSFHPDHFTIGQLGSWPPARNRGSLMIIGIISSIRQKQVRIKSSKFIGVLLRELFRLF